MRFIHLTNPIKLTKCMYLIIPAFLCFYYSFSAYNKSMSLAAIFEDIGATVVFLQIMTYPFCAYVCDFIEKNHNLQQKETICKISLLVLLFSQIVTTNIIFIFLLLYTIHQTYYKNIFNIAFKEREKMNPHIGACLLIIVLVSLILLWVNALI